MRNPGGWEILVINVVGCREERIAAIRGVTPRSYVHILDTPQSYIWTSAEIWTSQVIFWKCLFASTWQMWEYNKVLKQSKWKQNSSSFHHQPTLLQSDRSKFETRHHILGEDEHVFGHLFLCEIWCRGTMILCPERAICRISMTQFMGTVKTSVVHRLCRDVCRYQRDISSDPHPHSEDGTRGKSLLRSAPLVITHPIRQPLGNMPSDVRSILCCRESGWTVERPMGQECPLCG